MDPTRLFIGVITGAIGLGYFIYGRKQARAVPFLCGAGLFVIPYCIENMPILILACIALIIAPFVIKV